MATNPLTPSDPLLAEAVRRVVAAVAPLEVLLFGSRARGDARDDSDYDLLLVVSDGRQPRQDATTAHAALNGLAASFDILVLEQRAWERWSHIPVTFEHEIARDGEVMFRAAA